MPVQLANRNRVSTAAAVTAIVATAVLILAASLAYNIWSDYMTAKRFIEQRAISSAQVVAIHVEWLMAASLQTFEMIDRLAIDQDLHVAPETGVDLKALVGNLPGHPQASLFDKAGKLLFTTGDRSVSPDPNVQSILAQGSAATSPQISAMTEDVRDGNQHFVISRPVFRLCRCAM